MLNFTKILTHYLWNWNPEADFNSLNKLKEEWEQYVIVIKKSFWYWVFTSLNILFIILVLITNLYLVWKSAFNWAITYTIWSILAFNIFYLLWSLLRYIWFFRRIYWKYSRITNIYIWLAKLRDWDIVFAKYVNQSILNMLVMFLLSIYLIYLMIQNFTSVNIMLSILNIVLFLVQIYLSYFVLKKLINLEMDYFILTKNNVSLNLQDWFLASDWKSMGTAKIRNIDYKSNWLIPSLFHYWDILIETIGWWTWTSAVPSILHVVWQPQSTVSECNMLLDQKISKLEEVDNFYLSKILYESGCLDMNFVLEWNLSKNNIPEHIKYNHDIRNKIKNYLIKNESEIRKDFENWNEDTRHEIQEIYKEFLK